MFRKHDYSRSGRSRPSITHWPTLRLPCDHAAELGTAPNSRQLDLAAVARDSRLSDGRARWTTLVVGGTLLAPWVSILVLAHDSPCIDGIAGAHRGQPSRLTPLVPDRIAHHPPSINPISPTPRSSRLCGQSPLPRHRVPGVDGIGGWLAGGVKCTIHASIRLIPGRGNCRSTRHRGPFPVRATGQISPMGQALEPHSSGSTQQDSPMQRHPSAVRASVPACGLCGLLPTASIGWCCHLSLEVSGLSSSSWVTLAA